LNFSKVSTLNIVACLSQTSSRY